MLAINLESVGVIDFKMGSSEHIGGDDRMKLHKASHDRKVEVVVHVFEKPTGTQNKRKIVTDKSPTLECLMANISIKDGPPSSNKEKGKSFTFPALPSTMSKTKNCCQDVRTDIMTQNEGDEPENEEYTDEKNDYGSDSDEVLQERGPMYGSGRSQKYHPYDTKSNSPSSHSDSSQSSSPESSPRREPNTTHMANRLSGGSYVVCSGSQQNIRPASRAIDIEKSSALSRSSGGGIVQSAGPYLEPNVTGTLDILPQNFGSSPNRISQTSLDITPVSFMTVQEHPDYSPSVSSPASSTTDDFGVLSPFPYSPEIAPDIKKTLSDESFIEKFPEVRISPDSPDLSVFELCNPVTIGLTSFGKSLSGHLAESNPELEADVLQPSLLDEGIDGGSNKSPVVDDLGGMMEKYGVTHDDVAAKDSITFSLQDDIGSKPAQFLPQKDISTKSKPYSDHPVYNPSVGKGPTYFVTEAVGQLGTKSIPSSSVSFLPLLTRTQKLRLILPKPTNSTSPDLDVPATSSYTAPVAGPLKVTARERLKFHFTEEKINEAFDLVDCGKINLTDKNDLGDTNLHISIAGDELELTYAIVETLCKEKSRHDVGPLDVANNLGQTPLYVAVHKNNKLVVDYLLECGAKPSLACRDGTTPLHFVAMQGVDYLDVAEFLCRSPAISLNHSNAHGYTPLHCAVRHNGLKDTLPIIKILLKYDADLNIEDSRNGKTALVMAVEKSDVGAVKAICESCSKIGEKINYKSYHGTALHFAAQLNNVPENVQVSIVEILLRHGASCTIKNRQNKCPKNLVDKQRVKVKDLLRTPRRHK